MPKDQERKALRGLARKKSGGAEAEEEDHTDQVGGPKSPSNYPKESKTKKKRRGQAESE